MGYLITTKRPFWRYYLHEENKNRVFGMYRQTHACKRYFVTAYRLKTLNIAYQGGRAVTRIDSSVVEIDISVPSRLKQLSSRCSKNKKQFFNKINDKYWSSYVQWRNILLLTPNSVDKIVGKTSFYLHNYCVTNAVAVVYITLKS